MTHTEKSGKKPLPLEGVRIIDFSRLLPGPWATQMLGELGADVIKVEPPEIGDPSRHNQPRYKVNSVYFNAVNANKRSIVLDLGQDAGKDVARRLLANADVMVESYRPGVAAKLGIDYQAIKSYNPKIIYCAISGFGQSGPLSNIAGHDLVIQGLSGLMGCALDKANPPAVPGFQAADFSGALMAVIGIQAALAQRTKTGSGCEIDLAMFEALYQMCLIPLSSIMAEAAGYGGQRRMESFGGNPRYSTYLSQDGKPIAVSLLETKSWREFCLGIDRPDLVSENETPADRLSAHGENAELYRNALTDYCASHTAAEIMDRMERTGIAVCPVCTPEESLELAHISARKLMSHIDHPLEGRIPHLVNPLSRAGLADGVHRPAPALGQHADEILLDLGYSGQQISDLKKARAI